MPEDHGSYLTSGKAGKLKDVNFQDVVLLTSFSTLEYLEYEMSKVSDAFASVSLMCLQAGPQVKPLACKDS